MPIVGYMALGVFSFCTKHKRKAQYEIIVSDHIFELGCHCRPCAKLPGMLTHHEAIVSLMKKENSRCKMDRVLRKGVVGLCCAWLQLGKAATHGMTKADALKTHLSYKEHICQDYVFFNVLNKRLISHRPVHPFCDYLEPPKPRPFH